ncbi:MAG: SxtJ family membrane protein [Burkholderiales bacterium]
MWFDGVAADGVRSRLAKGVLLPSGLHESFEPQHEVRVASPRAFGVMLAVVLLVIALWPLVHAQPLRAWALAIALPAAVLAWLAPRIYAGPNRAWMKLGELLARVVSPLALAVLYFGMFVPLGWIMRLAGRRPLRLKRDPVAATYWIERAPRSAEHENMKHPF